jgi:hypothetical protein
VLGNAFRPQSTRSDPVQPSDNRAGATAGHLLKFRISAGQAT